MAMKLVSDAGHKTAAPKKKAPYYGTASVWSAPAKATQYLVNKGASRPVSVYNPPRTSSSGSSSGSSYSGPSAAQRAAQQAAAAAAKAAAEKTARENRENEATKKQVQALKKMLDTSFAKNRDVKLAAITQSLAQQDKVILSAFQDKAKGLQELHDNNEKNEHDLTHSNLQNRVRERGNIISEALSQGAGESDVLRAQMMAARNWSANQAEVNRAYFDTATNINNSINDLNADTRTDRVNLANRANKDKSSIWDSYYGQVTDTWMQIGNVEGQNNNDSYKKLYADAYDKAATAAGQAWKDPGVDKTLLDWKGEEERKETLNNTQEWSMQPRGLTTQKRPEGATLRKW